MEMNLWGQSHSYRASFLWERIIDKELFIATQSAECADWILHLQRYIEFSPNITEYASHIYFLGAWDISSQKPWIRDSSLPTFGLLLGGTLHDNERLLINLCSTCLSTSGSIVFCRVLSHFISKGLGFHFIPLHWTLKVLNKRSIIHTNGKLLLFSYCISVNFCAK